jgi:hypothetical protein
MVGGRRGAGARVKRVVWPGKRGIETFQRLQHTLSIGSGRDIVFSGFQVSLHGGSLP